jgi:hypothetical protein
MASRGTSIRLDVELRQKLDAIAEREIRTLSNQVTFFLKHAIRDYEEKSGITWFHNRYCNEDELEYGVLKPDDPGYDPNKRTLVVREKINHTVLQDSSEDDAEEDSPGIDSN